MNDLVFIAMLCLVSGVVLYVWLGSYVTTQCQKAAAMMQIQIDLQLAEMRRQTDLQLLEMYRQLDSCPRRMSKP